MAKIVECSSCGNCVDFVNEERCPVGAFKLEGNKYKSAVIEADLCIDCGLCKEEINCLGEALR